MGKRIRQKAAAAAVILLLLTAYCVFFADKMIFLADEIKTFAYIDEQKALELPLREGVLLRQPFKALGNRLQNFHFPFCGLTQGSDGLLTISIKNSRGEELCQKLLRQTQLFDCGTVNNRDFFITFFDVDIPVRNNETLYLDILLTESSGTPPSVWCYPSDESDKNMLPVQIGGVSQNVSLYAEYQRYELYKSEMYETEIWYIAAAYLLILVGLLLPIKRKNAQTVYILLPTVAFAAFELFWNDLSLIGGRYVLWNLAMLYLLFGLFAALFGRRRGAVIYSAAIMALAAANCFVNSFRGSPLSAEDLFLIKTALSVVGGYSYYLSGEKIIILAAVFFWTALGIRGISDNDAAFSKRQRVVFIAISAALLAVLFAFIPENGYKPSIGVSNYKVNGWLYANCAKSRLMKFRAPKGYSKERAESVLASVPEYAVSEIQPKNLIVIMNEAFSDLRIYPNSETNESPTPFFDSLTQNAEKGYLSVPVFGGDTVLTEWQMLCGVNSGVMDMTLPPYSFLFNGRYNTEGLCSAALESGYHAIAMHPHDDYNYNRRQVYDKMGFERFVSFWDYHVAEYNRGFVTDKDDYDMIMQYHSQMNGEKLFVFNVTMQNHGGYSGDMAEKEKTVWLSAAPDEEESSSYLSLLRKSDDALQYLISYFEKLNEPTMIVIFGDHQPALQDSVYERLLDGENHLDEYEMKFITPYMIWTNYEREQSTHIPYMSVSCFSAYIKRAAGLPLNSYDRFRLNYLERCPVFGKTGIYDSSYSYTPYSSLTEEQRLLIEDVSFVQYYHLTDIE